jgi:hypothetical protein
MMKHSIFIIKKLFHNPIMICFLKCAFCNTFFSKFKDLRIWLSHDDWRMGSDNKLGIFVNQIMNPCQHRHLPQGGEGGFWLIQNVNPISSKTMKKRGKEGLAV